MEKIKKGYSQKREDAVARKGQKIEKHGVFPMICRSRRSKSRLAKAAGAGPAGHMKGEKLHAIVTQSTCLVKFVKTQHHMLGALLEVEMLKKCAPVWRGAYIEMKHVRKHYSGSIFGS